MSNILNQIQIRSLSPKDDLIALTKLLNNSYKKLADQGFRYLASHQNVETTKQRIEKGKCFVATHNEKIIGTIVYYPSENLHGHAWYDQPFVATYGQFAVDAEFQKSGIGSKLISFVENLAMEEGAGEITVDTSEGATELINYYKKRGYRFVDFAQWSTTNYRSVILSKKL